MKATRYIYVYRDNSWGDLDTYKVGQTGGPTDKRAKRLCRNSSSYAGTEIVQEWEVPTSISDKKIHKFLESWGFIRANVANGRKAHESGNEVFHFRDRDPVAEVSKAINFLKHNTARRDDFKLRPAQQAAYDYVIKAFGTLGYTEFLLDCVPRFGKTFVSLCIAVYLGQTSGRRDIVIVTSRPSDTFEAWSEQIQNHVNFADMNLVLASEGADSYDSSKQNVVFSSLQYLQEPSNEECWIYKLDFALIIIDEEHHGAHTLKATKILDQFNATYKLWLSGTAYKSKVSGRFTNENMFTYSYCDSLKSEHPLPTMKMNILRIPQHVQDEARAQGWIKDDALHIGKLFSIDPNTGKFANRVQAESLMSALFDKSPMDQRIAHLSLFNNVDSIKELAHILIKGPRSVEACEFIVDFLSELLPQYDVILAAGQGKNAVKDAKELNARIQASSKTITVTCGRCTTGTTQPRWWTILLFDDSQSIEDVMQTYMRGATPDEGKNFFNVFDINPHRSLIMRAREIVEEQKRDPSKSFDELAYELCKLAPMFHRGDNGFEPVDVKAIHEAIVSDSAALLRSFNTSYGISTDNLSQDSLHVLESIDSLLSSRTQKSKIDIGDDNLEKGKTSKRTLPCSTELGKKDKNKYLKILQNIKARIPIGAIVANAESLEDLLCLEKELFYDIFKISCEQFEQLLDDCLDRERLENDIRALHSLTSLSYVNPEHISRLFSVYYSVEPTCPGTPAELASDMTEVMALAALPSPDVVFFDPYVTNGSIYIKLAELLDTKLEPMFPDRAERMEKIFNYHLVGAGSTLAEVAFTRRLAISRFGLDELDIKPRMWHYNDEAEFREGMRKMKKQISSKTWAVVGNPPYNHRDGGQGGSASPIYHKILNIVREELDPKYETNVIPSRWIFGTGKGGKEMAEFRKGMLQDRSMQYMKVFTSSETCFPPPTSIKGGVCYYLRNKDHDGKCEVSIVDGSFEATSLCYLDEEGTDAFNPNPVTRSILKKVKAHGFPSQKDRALAAKAFGLRTNEMSDVTSPVGEKTLKVYQNQSIGYRDPKTLPKGHEMVDTYQVIVPKACEGKGGENLQVITEPIIAEPGSVCTETYTVVDNLVTEEEAVMFKAYLKTRFARFLIHTKKPTQDAARGVYANLPAIGQQEMWTDESLYKYFDLTQEEIDFIELKVRASK